MKNQYDLCLEVLNRLQRAGILEKVIVIGSWCIYFFRSYFNDSSYSSSIRTRDLDFLVPIPTKFEKKPELGINAQALRFLDFLVENTIELEFENLKLKLPHPAAFGLHKLIISSREESRRRKEFMPNEIMRLHQDEERGVK